MAGTLVDAADTAYLNVLARWQAGTVRANLISFAQMYATSFSDDTPNDHPMVNWGAIVQAQATQMSTTNLLIDLVAVSTSAESIFNVCWMANELAGQSLITAAQANAVLAAYNTFIE